MARQKLSLFALLALSFLFVDSQTCPKGNLPPPSSQGLSFGLSDSLGAPFCFSKGPTGLPEFVRYAGGYTVQSPSLTVTTSDPCLQGPAALFDVNTQSSWFRGPSDDSSVIFQTGDFLSPYGLGLWNSGSASQSVKDSRLEAASSVNGPWQLVLTMTSAAYFDENTPQVFLIDNEDLGWFQYWRWTVISTWGTNSSSAVRELTFYVQPTAITKNFQANSPAPFYVSNRDLLLQQTDNNHPYFSTSSVAPYSLVLCPFMTVREDVVDTWAGLKWVAEGASSGIANFTLQTWDYGIAKKTKVGQVLCSGTQSARTAGGVCKTSWPTTNIPLFFFSTTDPTTDIQLITFEVFTCANTKCPPQLQTGIQVMNAATGQLESIATITPLASEQCGVSGVSPSTAILF